MPIPVLLWNFSAWVWNLQPENWNTIPNIGFPFSQCKKRHQPSFTYYRFLGLRHRDCSCWIDALSGSCKICHASTPPPLSPCCQSFRLEVSAQECDGAALGCGVLGRTLIGSFVTPCLPQQCSSRRNGIGGGRLRCLSSARGIRT
jgi:hypothetical protein